LKQGVGYITLYRGMLKRKLFIDGELKSEVIFDYYLEANLKDGTLVHVSFGKNAYFARMTFSNDIKPIDL
jgi:hypothetical protein